MDRNHRPAPRCRGNHRQSRAPPAVAAQRGHSAGQPVPSPSLQVHYEEPPPYCRPSRELGEYRTEHHVGIRNPDGNSVVTGVPVFWSAISPWPRLFNEAFTPSIPHAVPRDAGGDPTIEIDLPPGQLPIRTPTWWQTKIHLPDRRGRSATRRLQPCDNSRRWSYSVSP